MTWSKYKRLLVVLFIPLLIAGALFAYFHGPDPKYAQILCPNENNCWDATSLDKGAYDSIKSHDSWFQVEVEQFEKNNLPSTYIEASRQDIYGARIISVQTYAGTVDGPGSPTDQLRSLSGQDVSIRFGVGENEGRPLNPIGCNELIYGNRPGSYTAGLCGVPGGVVSVNFAVEGKDAVRLGALKAAVDAEVKHVRTNFILRFVLGVPVFLVLFLILSGVMWLIGRSISYVTSG